MADEKDDAVPQEHEKGVMPAAPKALDELNAPNDGEGPRGEPVVNDEGSAQQAAIIAEKQRMSEEAAAKAREASANDDADAEGDDVADEGQIEGDDERN